MKAEEIQIGSVYEVRISNRLQPVRVDETHPGGGWRGTNLRTGAPVRVIGPSKFRRLYIEGEIMRPIGELPQDTEFEGQEELATYAEQIVKELTSGSKDNPLSGSKRRSRPG